MPFITAMWASFAAIVGQLGVKALTAIGFGVLTYNGVKPLLDDVLVMVQSEVSGLSADAISLLAICRIDDAVTVIFSAYVARLTLMGMNAAGALRRFGAKPPSVE